MFITDDARDAFKELLVSKNASGIRLYFAGYGWGGPNFGLSLDEAKENEIVKVINQIQVAMDPSLEEYTTDMTIDYPQSIKRFILNSGNNCC